MKVSFFLKLWLDYFLSNWRAAEPFSKARAIVNCSLYQQWIELFDGSIANLLLSLRVDSSLDGNIFEKFDTFVLPLLVTWRAMVNDNTLKVLSRGHSEDLSCVHDETNVLSSSHLNFLVFAYNSSFCFAFVVVNSSRCFWLIPFSLNDEGKM